MHRLCFWIFILFGPAISSCQKELRRPGEPTTTTNTPTTPQPTPPTLPVPTPPLPPTTPPIPPTQIPDSMGRVIFWTHLAVGDDRHPSITNIEIGNRAIVMDWFYPDDGPLSCSDNILNINPGGKIDLLPGGYSWRATYVNYVARGSVTITRGTCVLQEIVF